MIVEQVRRTLVGDFVAERSVILTSISGIFHGFSEAGWSAQEHEGWWPRLERDGVHIILIPQGSALLDLAPTLQETPRVHLLGYAGSLTAAVDVGEIVSPAKALHPAGPHQARPLAGDDALVISSVPNLLAGYAIYESSTRPDLVDMESGHLAHALVNSEKLTVRVLITDRWPDKPFYVASTNDPRFLVRRRLDLVTQCIEDVT
ncbi:hypothetical protein [Actinomyces sp. SKVG-SVH-4(1)]|uniref:hypothetical protein n=1 Tax=Actinomyces sp. SKVG-SVH-4(1) TaxID=3240382 RepID=UPI003AF2C2EE